MSAWIEGLSGRTWRYLPDRCIYVSGQFSPIARDTVIVTDQTLATLRHTEFGQKLFAIVTGKAA